MEEWKTVRGNQMVSIQKFFDMFEPTAATNTTTVTATTGSATTNTTNTNLVQQQQMHGGQVMTATGAAVSSVTPTTTTGTTNSTPILITTTTGQTTNANLGSGNANIPILVGSNAQGVLILVRYERNTDEKLTYICQRRLF